MNINASFPSKYIKSAEVSEEGVTLTIDRVEQEDVDGKGTFKPVLYFQKAKKGLVLNVTNAKKITNLLGTGETDEWAGKAITIYQGETEFNGETVACIRVKGKPNGKPAPYVAPATAPPISDEDIPF